jgi:ABC-type enterochelin transport system substrate-binding protein
MGVLYGTTLKQKWETLSQIFKKEDKVKPEPVPAHN